jgi:predicted secreted protein
VRRDLVASVVLLTATTHAVATVPVGEIVQVELQDISTTGYRWQLQDFPRSIVVLQREDTRPGKAPGAAGVRVFELRAVGAGKVTLHFDLRRPWETNQPPIKESTLDLTVE